MSSPTSKRLTELRIAKGYFLAKRKKDVFGVNMISKTKITIVADE